MWHLRGLASFVDSLHSALPCSDFFYPPTVSTLMRATTSLFPFPWAVVEHATTTPLIQKLHHIENYALKEVLNFCPTRLRQHKCRWQPQNTHYAFAVNQGWANLFIN